MTRSQPNEASRRADGQPKLVAVHILPEQARPLLVTTARPWAIAAPEMLREADRLLAAQGRGLAVKLPAIVGHGTSTS